MPEPMNEVVEKPVESGAEPTPAVNSEEVSSPEVKVEAPVEPKIDSTPATNNVDVSKLQSQVENLNTALRQEREAAKKTAQELEEKLSRSSETIDKLKNVFSPEVPEEPQESVVTMDQIESLLESKEEQRKEEERRLSQQAKIKEEISTLESTWDGTDGKPKYEDSKVLEWQEKVGKLHLSPQEAFNEMNRDAIIDWEIKQRLAQKPAVENVETPGALPTGREPVEKKPKTTEELRGAVLEAMSSFSDENNN